MNFFSKTSLEQLVLNIVPCANLCQKWNQTFKYLKKVDKACTYVGADTWVTKLLFNVSFFYGLAFYF